jgi:hypothetical protein
MLLTEEIINCVHGSETLDLWTLPIVSNSKYLAFLETVSVSVFRRGEGDATLLGPVTEVSSF